MPIISDSSPIIMMIPNLMILKKIAIYIETGADGIFNDGDYLLFYGQGTGQVEIQFIVR